MIDYFTQDGQLYAEVRKIRPGYIWYVFWGEKLLTPILYRLSPVPAVPEDIQ